MSGERMRFVGGELQGRVVWVEQGSPTVAVHMAGQRPGMTRTLHYRRSGAVLRFVEETETAPVPTGGGSA